LRRGNLQFKQNWQLTSVISPSSSPYLLNFTWQAAFLNFTLQSVGVNSSVLADEINDSVVSLQFQRWCALRNATQNNVSICAQMFKFTVEKTTNKATHQQRSATFPGRCPRTACGRTAACLLQRSIYAGQVTLQDLQRENAAGKRNLLTELLWAKGHLLQLQQTAMQHPWLFPSLASSIWGQREAAAVVQARNVLDKSAKQANWDFYE